MFTSIHTGHGQITPISGRRELFLMNILSFSGFFDRLRYRLIQHSRLLDVRANVASFSATESDDTIQRIYVINLDRKPDRWHQISRELGRFSERSGTPLSSITRRFSAIDARYLEGETDDKTLRPYYSLAEQLLVEPNPRLSINAESRERRIRMTPQEIAVALSHIDVWKLIVTSDIPYTLVLEDDAYFRRGFARNFDVAWLTLMRRTSESSSFDLLHLSFHEVGTRPQAHDKQPPGPIRRPDCGIWQASGYVLSQAGARKLLELLPAHGPIDLWLNLQFGKLDVLTTRHPIIEQRIDVPSSNSYSVMPVLSQVGVHTREKPLIVRAQELPGPVFACGEPGSGLTSLAMALSMLGYTCCSDIRELPHQEQNNLLAKRRERNFNAYVNIGSLNDESLTNVTTLYPNARFIVTTLDQVQLLVLTADRVLYLPHEHPDKWAALSKFLLLEYPPLPYPLQEDIGQRGITKRDDKNRNSLPCKQLKFDSSPWILSSKEWSGIAVVEVRQADKFKTGATWNWNRGTDLDESHWRLRDDTFPSNLALFRPSNFTIDSSETGKLTLRKETTPVRSFTSAAIASQHEFLYGIFTADLRPSNVSGLITGMFLHRNGPRQEIDIEFLGKDTTKMLVNVFYNPGIAGTKLEYGYRGTPTLIELGFDAAEEFHRYEIEWHPYVIRWRVDGYIVHERVLWDPTPIPNLPMEFNLNLWHSRSKELAGKLDTAGIPAHAEVRSIRIIQNSNRSHLPERTLAEQQEV
jgi:beta-glucanase (GH16 family)/GR25 family glycosyltransferase involved in LPS biosynthesis